jgi:type IV pilus assembly protein PilB
MLLTIEQLKKIVVEPGHIAAEEFAKLESEAQRKKTSPADLIVSKDIITDEQMGQLIAQEFKWKFINLKNEKISSDDLRKIPEKIAQAKQVILFGSGNGRLKIGMVNPGDMKGLHFIRKYIGKEMEVYFITERDFKRAMLQYKSGLQDEVKEIFDNFHKKASGNESRDKLIVSLLDALLVNAYHSRVSDIHIEPIAKQVVIRFRIDGVMHTVLNIEKDFFSSLVQRIKILARMKIDEHLTAQDGKLQFSAEGEKVDVRVSIIPISEGENVVMRILSSKSRQMSLASLGFSPVKMSLLEEALKNPHGMILVVGPTGSGKTTTLYEIIKKLNIDEVHIASIEDPVEYNMEGVSQMQVNPNVDLDFAKGLRAILRQDPDIIMVGEIRDAETAKIAVGAAMTGHLVLSTEHSNNSTTALIRLLELGVEPFMTASTIKVIIAQRLVRMICPICRFSYTLTEEERAAIAVKPELKQLVEKIYKKNLDQITMYKGSGCKVCSNTGFAGRVGIFEVLEIKPNIREAVIHEASDNHLMAVARQNGMETMLEDGLRKTMTGVTTLSEVLRVIIE